MQGEGCQCWFRRALVAALMRKVVRATIDDTVPQLYSREQADAIIASYPEHERQARAHGIPALGSGRVFPIDLADIIVEPFSIPRTWKRIIGTDFGWDHPFGAMNMAFDADADCLYLINEYRKREATPVVHAAAIKPWGAWIPVAWPHDGLQHDKGSGVQLKELYREQGCAMLEEKATFEDGGFGLEAGVIEMLDRMQTGRWKVFRPCGAWIEEASYYHRVEGVIVKEHDDLISASRIAMMMRRYARTAPGGSFPLDQPLYARRGTQA